jgi:hypothetical protein
MFVSLWRELIPLWRTTPGLRQLWPHLMPLTGVLLLGDSPLLAFYLLLVELLLAMWARLAALSWCTAQLFEPFAQSPIASLGTALSLFLALAGFLAALVLAPALMAFAPVLAMNNETLSLALRLDNPFWLALFPIAWLHCTQGFDQARQWQCLTPTALVQRFQQTMEPVLIRAFLIACFGVYCWLFGGYGIYIGLLLIAHLLAWADLHPQRLQRSA